jgi:hypothetical protein
MVHLSTNESGMKKEVRCVDCCTDAVHVRSIANGHPQGEDTQSCESWDMFASATVGQEVRYSLIEVEREVFSGG